MKEKMYLSTRGEQKPLNFYEAILQGIGSDGGLLVPEFDVDQKDLKALLHMNYVDMATEIISTFTPDDVKEDIRKLCQKAYGDGLFPKDVVPVEKAGITAKTYTAADSNDIQQVVTKAADENDAIYIPTDNTIASNMEIVKNVTVPAKVPVIAGEENMCSVGGLATLSISYESIGYNAGLMAYDILVNGKNPADMPIQYADDVTLKYNADIASELGIEIPDDMVAIEKEDK